MLNTCICSYVPFASKEQGVHQLKAAVGHSKKFLELGLFLVRIGVLKGQPFNKAKKINGLVLVMWQKKLR